MWGGGRPPLVEKGTAILLHAEHLGLDEAPQHEVHYEGRVVTCRVKIEDTHTPLVCMYVPANPRERGDFVEAWARQKWVTRNAIVQADFNSVPNPSLDVRYPLGKDSREYSNTHAHAIEALLAGAGLEDKYRAYAGNTRTYTRHGETVLTRLDRWYGPATDSPLVWQDIDTDIHFGRQARRGSDHYAITATVSPQRTQVKHKPLHKIDATLYQDPSMRPIIEGLWSGIYTKYPVDDYGRAQVWEIFKRELHLMMLTETKERRSARTRHAPLWRREAASLVERNNREGPSTDRNARLRRLDELISDSATTKRPT